MFAGCGDELENLLDAGFFQFTSGTYAVTNATAPQTDQCGLLGAYQDPTKVIGVTVENGQVTFNLSNDPNDSPTWFPKATLAGNAIAQPVEANYTAVMDPNNCSVRIKRTVTGTVVKDNSANLTLSFNVATEAGTCTANNTVFDAVPCASTYTFTATKK